MQEQLAAVAEEVGERVLSSPGNSISIAMTLDNLRPTSADTGGPGKEGGLGGAAARAVTALGAALWQRRVSGVRVVARGAEAAVAGVPFSGYGSSCQAYPHDYLTAAAAVGGCAQEVDVFVHKLRAAYVLCRRRQAGGDEKQPP